MAEPRPRMGGASGFACMVWLPSPPSTDFLSSDKARPRWPMEGANQSPSPMRTGRVLLRRRAEKGGLWAGPIPVIRVGTLRTTATPSAPLPPMACTFLPPRSLTEPLPPCWFAYFRGAGTRWVITGSAGIPQTHFPTAPLRRLPSSQGRGERGEEVGEGGLPTSSTPPAPGRPVDCSAR